MISLQPCLTQEPTDSLLEEVDEGTTLISPPHSDNRLSEKSGNSFYNAISYWKKELSSISPMFSLNSWPAYHTKNILYSVFQKIDDITPIKKLSGIPQSEMNDKIQFEQLVTEAKSVLELGEELNQPKLIQTGSSGSYFIYDRNGAILGVFKPRDEEPYGTFSPKITKWVHRTFFPCFFGRSCLIPNTGYIAESAGSLLDRLLNLNLVPYTDIVEFQSKNFYFPLSDQLKNKISGEICYPKKVGSFQTFLHGYTGADIFFEKYPLPGYRYSYLSNEISQNNGTWSCGHKIWSQGQVLEDFRVQVEKLIIFDFIIRNTDRGLDNWMLKLEHDEGKDPKITVKAIDNGLSFPWKHPNEWRSFPYGWLFLPLPFLSTPFAEETRQHFLQFLTSVVWWQNTVECLHEIYAKDSEFSEYLFEKQIQVLKGQSWNVVQTLKNKQGGPLDLVRKPQIIIIDEKVTLPSSCYTSIINSSKGKINPHVRKSLILHSDKNQPTLKLGTSNSAPLSSIERISDENLEWDHHRNSSSNEFTDDSNYEHRGPKPLEQTLKKGPYIFSKWKFGYSTGNLSRRIVNRLQITTALDRKQTFVIERVQVVKDSAFFTCC